MNQIHTECVYGQTLNRRFIKVFLLSGNVMDNAIDGTVVILTRLYSGIVKHYSFTSAGSIYAFIKKYIIYFVCTICLVHMLYCLIIFLSTFYFCTKSLFSCNYTRAIFSLSLFINLVFIICLMNVYYEMSLTANYTIDNLIHSSL